MGKEGTGKLGTPIAFVATELMVDSIDADDDIFELVGTILLEMATNEGGCIALAGDGDDMAFICVWPTLICIKFAAPLAELFVIVAVAVGSPTPGTDAPMGVGTPVDIPELLFAFLLFPVRICTVAGRLIDDATGVRNCTIFWQININNKIDINIKN